MAEEKETREELKDLDPKKDPKGGALHGQLEWHDDPRQRGETPRLDKP